MIREDCKGQPKMVYIRKELTGEIRAHELTSIEWQKTWFDTKELLCFDWAENNRSCDCSRAQLWAWAGGDPDPDIPCSDGLYRVRIISGDETILDEWEPVDVFDCLSCGLSDTPGFVDGVVHCSRCGWHRGPEQ